MRAAVAFLLALVLPSLVLGPGWDLRICAHRLVRAECCGIEQARACCPDEAPTPAEPVAQRPEPAMVCCIAIETAHECAARGPERADAGSLERAHLAALVPLAAVLAPRAPARLERAPDDRPPPPPGRCTPLPLRI